MLINPYLSVNKDPIVPKREYVLPLPYEPYITKFELIPFKASLTIGYATHK